MLKSVLAALSVLVLVGSAHAGWQPVAGGTGGAYITVLEQNAGRTVFEVSVPGLELTPVITEKGKFSRLSLPGEVMAVIEEGKPEVPKVSVLLAIPSGARVSAQVVEKETKRLPVARVYPLQPPLLDGEEPGPTAFDQGFYGRDVSFPGYDVKLIETGVWRDLHVANLQVYPVQVNPARAEVEVASRIRVEVDYSGGIYPTRVAEWMLPIYSEYVDNFGQLLLEPQDDYTPGVRYLVISHTDFSSDSYLTDSLMGWVKQRGYETRLIAKSAFTTQEIKDSILAEYERNDPRTLRWVLLVGDYTVVPSAAYTTVVPVSDFWFSDLDPPAGDNYPEVGIARLSPTNTDDLDNQVRKILLYQKNPPATGDWLDKLSMVAHMQDYPGKYSGCVRGVYKMSKPYWEPSVVETVMGQYKGNSTVAAAINQGRGIVNYRGHGGDTEWSGWGTQGSWYNSNVNALANGDLTPVVYNIACWCGNIARIECLSEKWMRKYPGGAVASLAASNPSYTLPNHGICSTLVRATCDEWTILGPGGRKYGPTPYNLADIQHYGVSAYVAKYWPGSPFPQNIWMYLTLGDPAMPVWCGGMPRTPTVLHPDSILMGNDTLRVVVCVNGRPVEGALVCAWKDPDFYVSCRTDTQGLAPLPVNAATAGPVLLTVSEGHAGHSRSGARHTPILPYETTIQAGGSSQSVLGYVSNAVNDSPPAGNGNGQFDPGETGEILVTICNVGNMQADNVTATLASGLPEFAVTQPGAYYGSIPAGQQQTNLAEPFEASASGSIPDGTVVPCTLKLQSSKWGDFTQVFTLTVGEALPGMAMTDHDTGYCRLSVSCFGAIGHDGWPSRYMGSGFSYPKAGPDVLLYSGLAVGNSPVYVADRYYGAVDDGAPDDDLMPVDSLRSVVPPLAGHEHFQATYDDAGHPAAMGLEVTQNTYQSGDPAYDDFVVLCFDIANYGASEMDSIYAGVFADFNIGTFPSANVATSDEQRRMTWMRATASPDPSVGVKILAPDSFANLAALDNEFNLKMTDIVKLQYLNGTIQQRNSDRAYDWAVCTSVGPFDLPVGTHQRFAVAFVGGTDENELKANADSAQSWYLNNVGVAEEGRPASVGSAARLSVRPNPFSRRTSLHYSLPVPGRVELRAYDAAGREVAETAFDAEQGNGRYLWQPADLAPGVYFLRIETPDRESVAKVMLLD